MRDEVAELAGWQQQGATFALATVVGTSHSAPRPAGSVLALHPDGRIVGNVSGGCVEPAVVDIAQQVLADGIPRRARFGYSDAEAFAVGLTCGGEVDVLVRQVTPDTLPLAPLVTALAEDTAAVLATVVDAPDDAHVGMSVLLTGAGTTGSLAGTRLGRVIADECRTAIGRSEVTLRHLGADGERMRDEATVLIESFSERPQMIVFGAIDYAAAVASIGRFLGYRVTVCDARAAFATRERFPEADEIVVEWPHRHLERTTLDGRSVVIVLTHDPKFDVPAIVAALRTPARYVGVMGSRRTHEDRIVRLREAGVDEAGLARLRSPIGLDLGGRTPQETAVSIAAELVMTAHATSGRPLRETDGPIHPAPPADGRPVGRR